MGITPGTLFTGLIVFAAIMAFVFALAGPIQALQDYLFGHHQAGLEERLQRTFSPLSPAGFVMMQIGVALGLGTVGVFLGPNLLLKGILALTFAGVGLWGTEQFLRILQRRYRKQFDQQFAEAVGMIANSVKAGLSVIQALEMTAQEFEAPIGLELRDVVQELRLGIPLDTALQDWAARVQSDDMDIFVTAVVIQRQTGGNLTEVLENLSATIRERRKIQGQIMTLTAQGRLSGQLLTVLPIFLSLMIQSIAPQYGVMELLKNPLGWALLGLAAAMLATGAYVINRITTIDV